MVLFKLIIIEFNSVWYFGDLGCRIAQYASYVTAYVIVSLLVLMSFDRYTAINSLKVRRSRSFAKYASITLWCIVLITNIPQLYLHSQHEYTNYLNNENRTTCILNYGPKMMDLDASDSTRSSYIFKIQIYYLVFFLLAYVFPFTSIIIIYSKIMKILVNSKGQQLNKNKRRITFMVIAVVASFVICWTPLHIMLFLQHVVKVRFTEVHAMFLILSNCIAYLNACVNPIIYGFANVNFRA